MPRLIPKPIKKPTYAQMEVLGQLADKMEDYIAGTVLPMAPAFHIEAMKGCLRDAAKDLRTFYVEIVGEDPWEGT